MKRLGAGLDLAWAYASELLLAGLLFFLIVHQFGASAVQNFMFATSKHWSNLALYLFSASVATWIVVLASIILTPFGRYLGEEGAARVYLIATATPMIVFLTAWLAATLTDVYKTGWLAASALALLLYSLINAWTLVTNVLDLVSFYLAYHARQSQSAKAMDNGAKNRS